ncbi:MAG: amidohydrolase family protein [Alphaproteobacteria bacterium]|nr:amidohydrolase family protein [Alphaproteobacteria bacterium]MBU0798497.1 amidohydrolase family protein [Alphaproteobacteria bacterium]MBU0888306.1 amidohydrolase family protein [Alphaproteobacteria bacterium]MBU1812863.1 amidohydrolase family protein [Alphaproteobacteria bacterium]
MSGNQEVASALRLPKLKTPKGACDCHIHFYGPPEQYTIAPTRPGTPPLATVEAYRALMQRWGTERVVVVQPSAYALDNSCTMDAMAALGPDVARGVVVVDDSVSDDELEAFTKAGVRGLRYFMMPGGVLPWESLPRMAARVHEIGWHIQLQFDGAQMLDRVETIRALPGTVVIDHNGKFLDPVSPSDRRFLAYLDMLETGRVWNKLAGPYETSKQAYPYGDVGAMARALVRTAPDRMLWASNWPHPNPFARQKNPDNIELLDVLLEWVEEDAVRDRILVDNPAELYGFPKP